MVDIITPQTGSVDDRNDGTVEESVAQQPQKKKAKTLGVEDKSRTHSCQSAGKIPQNIKILIVC